MYKTIHNPQYFLYSIYESFVQISSDFVWPNQLIFTIFRFFYLKLGYFSSKATLFLHKRF